MAALAKAGQTRELELVLRRVVRAASASRVLARVVPVAELLIGVCLLTAVAIVAADAAATVAGFVFAGFQLVKPAGVPCRCFGRLDDHVGHGAAVARAATLLLAGAIATGIRLSTGTPLSIAHIHQSFVYPIVGAMTALAAIAAAAVLTEVATR